jgi:uncharacterized membrane protein (DUF106 family)
MKIFNVLYNILLTILTVVSGIYSLFLFALVFHPQILYANAVEASYTEVSAVIPPELIPTNDVTAMWIIAIIILGFMFFILPTMFAGFYRIFRHYEARMKELSDDYKKRADEKEKEHYNNIKYFIDLFHNNDFESNKKILELIENHINSIETKIGKEQ